MRFHKNVTSPVAMAKFAARCFCVQRSIIRHPSPKFKKEWRGMANLSTLASSLQSAAGQQLRSIAQAAVLGDTNRFLRIQIGQERSQRPNVLVHGFHVVESACADYPLSLRLACMATEGGLSPTVFLGQPVRLQMVTDSGQLRSFCAIIERAQSLPGNGGGGQTWLLEAVDAMTLMRQTRRSRILQGKTVVDVIEVILRAWSSELGDCFTYNLDLLQSGAYPAREMSIQWNESDSAFLQRLCRKHAIGWGIQSEQSETGPIRHTLVFFDATAKFAANRAGTLLFHADSATQSRDVITVWAPMGALTPGAVEGRSWNYKTQGTSQYQSPTLMDFGTQGNRVADALIEAQVHAPHWADSDAEYGKLGDHRMQFHEMQASLVQGGGNSRDATVLSQVRVQNIPATGLGKRQQAGAYSSPSLAGGDYVYLHVEHWGQNNLPEELSDWMNALLAANGWSLQPPNVGNFDTERRYTNTFLAVGQEVPIVPAFDPTTDWPNLPAMSAVVVCPEGEEVYCDKYGRVFVRFPGLRVEDHEHAHGAGTNGTPGDSAPIRVAMPAANAEAGMLQLPRKGDEVLVTFINGDPDKPIITHSIHSPVQVPTTFHGINTLPGNRYLSGNRSKEIRGSNATHILHDNTPQQTSLQLHADQSYSQLTLGHVTSPRSNGNANSRGEGFEVRTDGHGAIRAKDGLLITTEARLRAVSSITSMDETVQRLVQADQTQNDLGGSATAAKAQDSDDQVQVAADLSAQNQAIQGSTESGVGELIKPHLVLASPAGIATSTAGSTHQASLGHHAITAHGHISLSTSQKILLSAKQGLRLFARKLGIRMVAAIDRILIQAQQDGIDLSAQKDIHIISTDDAIYITASKKVIINGAGSQTEWAASGITHKTSGAWVEHAASHDSPGPDNASTPTPEPAQPSKDTFVFSLLTHEQAGGARANTPYALYKDGALLNHGMTDEFGQVVIPDHQDSTAQYKVVLFNGAEYTVPIHETLQNAHRSSNSGLRTDD